LSADGRDVQPLALGPLAERRGALALIELMAEGGAAPRLAGAKLPLSAIKLDAPIPLPRRNIFCSGVNYRAHAAEWRQGGFDAAPDAQDEPDEPVIFSKVPECVIGPGAAIRIPDASSAIDYEAELAVVIGKAGVRISASRAMDHVWGYTAFNDVTARDLQRKHRQWLIGKSLDTFGPMGPWLVSADELDAADTRVRCFVNGELRQDASTRDLIFGIPRLIESISAGITLRPGDIIATGTPSGVGIGFNPPKFLQRGDRVKVEIEGIGALENPVH
jgi:2-keto-4-pentenoate hydratase/2-oxohepta-3-ene-1,7-dioic acid hydratase in catechol pathway